MAGRPKFKSFSVIYNSHYCIVVTPFVMSQRASLFTLSLKGLGLEVKDHEVSGEGGAVCFWPPRHLVARENKQEIAAAVTFCSCETRL